MKHKRSKYFLTPKKRKINYLLINKNSTITVVFFHGFMSDMIGKKPIAIQKFCKKQKINFLKFEYSGHGKSSEKFIDGNISKWTDDARSLIKSKIKKKNKLIFIGSSMGGWIALNLFKYFKKRIIGFIGIAAAPEFLEKLMWNKFSKKIKKIIMTKKIYNLEHHEYSYPLTKQLILDGKKNKIINSEINLNIPIVLLHGKKDKVVPLKISRNILKICRKAKRKFIIIKNGDHSLSKKSHLKILCNELKIVIKNFTN